MPRQMYIVNLCFLFFIRYVRNRIDHWCTVEPRNPNPRVHRSSGKLGEASFPTGTVDSRVGISLSPLNTNDGFSLYQWSRRLSVCLSVDIFKLEYLCNQWANRNKLLTEPSLGWGKGCIRFWARSDRNSGVHGNG